MVSFRVLLCTVRSPMAFLTETLEYRVNCECNRVVSRLICHLQY